MILQIFAIHDTAMNAFANPFFMHSQGEALRGFKEVVNDKTTKLNQYPDAFTLFHLGTFNAETGALTSFKTPESLGLALTFKDN